MPASDAMPTPAMAIRWTCRGEAGMSGRDGADDEVMDLWAELANEVVVARRMHAIRKHEHVHVAVEVDPKRRAGEADVADRVPRELVARGRSFERRRIPAERPRRRADGIVAPPE